MRTTTTLNIPRSTSRGHFLIYSVCQEDLWGDGGRESPRFTLLIVDVDEQEGEGGQPGAVAVPCAVVLIPRGRDRDFTFSSREGLGQVTINQLMQCVQGCAPIMCQCHVTVFVLVGVKQVRRGSWNRRLFFLVDICFFFV